MQLMVVAMPGFVGCRDIARVQASQEEACASADPGLEPPLAGTLT